VVTVAIGVLSQLEEHNGVIVDLLVPGNVILESHQVQTAETPAVEMHVLQFEILAHAFGQSATAPILSGE